MLFILKVLIIAFYFLVSIVPTAIIWYGLNLLLDFYDLTLNFYSLITIFILFGWLIFWFYVFFVNIRKKKLIGVIFALEKPTKREEGSGPYLKFPWIEESVEFSVEPHAEHVAFSKEDDIFVSGDNYLVGDIEIVWRVKDPKKYYLYETLIGTKKEDLSEGKAIATILHDFVVAAVRLYAVEKVMINNKLEYPDIDYILKNGRKDLPDRIISELTMKEVDGRVLETRETIEDWGIELVTRPRVRDIDPLPEVKESQKRAAKAIFDKKETITVGEADLEKRKLGAQAKEAEGFADAAIEGKKIEKELSAFLEAVGIAKENKEEAMDFILTRIGLTSVKSGDKIILGTSGIIDLAKEFAASLKEGKK